MSSHFTFRRASTRAIGLALLVVAGLSLTACKSLTDKLPDASSVGAIVTPYKIDIVQGNVITKEQVALLKAGMPRTQVRDLLGTPLLASVFHADRWDYVFTFKRQGQEFQKRKMAVFFKDDVLDHFEADDMPSEAEFVASLDKKRRGEAPPLEATEEQLKQFAEKNPPKAAGTTGGADATPSRTYPPLESSSGASQ